jgi:hypothetical protein
MAQIPIQSQSEESKEESATWEKQYAVLEKRYDELFEEVGHLLSALKLAQRQTEELLKEKRVKGRQ